MTHRLTVQAVARRLPHLPKYTVAEVLEVAAEVWAAELAQSGGVVTIVNLAGCMLKPSKCRLAAQSAKS